MVFLLGAARNQQEVNVNQPPAASLNYNFSCSPHVHGMSWPSFGMKVLENTTCQRTFPNVKTLRSVKKIFHTQFNWKLWLLDSTAWWYFSKASELLWEQSQKNEQQGWHSATLAFNQETGPTWQHFFCRLMVSKWADTAHLWLALLWHLIHS